MGNKPQKLRHAKSRGRRHVVVPALERTPCAAPLAVSTSKIRRRHQNTCDDSTRVFSVWRRHYVFERVAASGAPGHRRCPCQTQIQPVPRETLASTKVDIVAVVLQREITRLHKEHTLHEPALFRLLSPDRDTQPLCVRARLNGDAAVFVKHAYVARTRQTLT